jgi:uncharacterized protein (DUF1778 family)
MTERVVWHVVREFAWKAGVVTLAPHDLRRTCAKLCYAAGGELEQIRFLLGMFRFRQRRITWAASSASRELSTTASESNRRSWEASCSEARPHLRGMNTRLTCTAFSRTLLMENRMAQEQVRKVRRGPSKLERLEARVTREQKQIIARAAELRGTSVTEFVVASAQQAATNAIKDYETMSLRGAARETFVKALLNPPAPNSAATRAADRYGKRVSR